MENKQTVVDWLEENLIGNPHFESDFIHNINVFNQAKQMEREQIEEAYNNGGEHYTEYGKAILGEDYYNETYGK